MFELTTSRSPVKYVASWLPLTSAWRITYHLVAASGTVTFRGHLLTSVHCLSCGVSPANGQHLAIGVCTPKASVYKERLAQLQPASCVRRLAHLFPWSLMLRPASSVSRMLCCISPGSVSQVASPVRPLVVSHTAFHASPSSVSFTIRQRLVDSILHASG